MSATPDPTTPERESEYHTYATHVIPWYVRLMWILFWMFAISYAVRNFLPAIQTELLTPP